MFFWGTRHLEGASLNPVTRFRQASLPQRAGMAGESIGLALLLISAGLLTARLFLKTPCPLGNLVDRIGAHLPGATKLIPGGVLVGIFLAVLGGEGAGCLYMKVRSRETGAEESETESGQEEKGGFGGVGKHQAGHHPVTGQSGQPAARPQPTGDAASSSGRPGQPKPPSGDRTENSSSGIVTETGSFMDKLTRFGGKVRGYAADADFHTVSRNRDPKKYTVPTPSSQKGKEKPKSQTNT